MTPVRSCYHDIVYNLRWRPAVDHPCVPFYVGDHEAPFLEKLYETPVAVFKQILAPAAHVVKPEKGVNASNSDAPRQLIGYGVFLYNLDSNNEYSGYNCDDFKR